MIDQSLVSQESQCRLAGKPVDECLSKFSSKELMDALMAADLPMGGSNMQRIERLLSVGYPQDVFQFFHRDALQRVAHMLD
ncbi:MAG: hypothetical protein A2V62_05485 [Nitrospirae bacterium RBG_19FT_COMBO_58_9]|nr:MAG: hypothetical protein A2V62_05485 [Nitrospirae bacterium RBG_19FT_COMBO_58_9]